MTDLKSSNVAAEEKNHPSFLQFIPPYIREVCKKPTSVELRVNYDAPTLQTTYTYTITWDGGNTDLNDKYSEVSTTKSASNLAGGAVPPVDAMCDGPCKRVFKSNLLNTIGRCGHYLCNACFGIVINEDGTAGCSSINCYWKGGSREETRKNYEKEVCRKQRERARDMQARGIDVKVASISNIQPTDVTSSAPKTEVTPTTITPMTTLTTGPPSDSTLIKAKLILLELSDTGGMTHRFSTKRLPSMNKMLKVLARLIERKKLNALEMLARGTVYYAQERPDLERELCLIDRRDFGDLCLYHFPKVEDMVVFVLDLNDFVKNGQEVYFE